MEKPDQDAAYRLQGPTHPARWHPGPGPIILTRLNVEFLFLCLILNKYSKMINVSSSMDANNLNMIFFPCQPIKVFVCPLVHSSIKLLRQQFDWEIFVSFFFLFTATWPSSTHPWFKGKWSVRFHHCHDCRVQAQKESGTDAARQVAQMGKEWQQQGEGEKKQSG